MDPLPPRPDALPYRDCVGVVLINREGKIFAGRRLDQDAGEAWQMPQGGIDPGEDPKRAAFRELKEEIGTDKAEILAEASGWLAYDLPSHLVGVALKGRYRGQRLKFFAMRFLGGDEDIALDAHHPEFDAWAWLTPEEMTKRIVAFKRPLYVRVFEEFARYLKPA